MKKKIAVVTTNRADYDQIFWLISELKKEKKISLRLVVTGAHLEKRFGYSLNQIKKDKMKLNKVYLNIKGDKSEDILKIISEGIIKFASIFKKFKPHYLILLGDRYETLAIGIAANFKKIPIIHLNGGELTLGSHDDWIRHCLTKISDVHFVANNIYKKRVIQLGENPKNVFTTGGLSSDNAIKTNKIDLPKLEKKLNISFQKRNILVTYHPETLNNIDNIKSFLEIFKVIKYFKEINFFITCPNADEGNIKLIKKIKKISKLQKNCYFFYSLGRVNYLSLLNNCDLLLGNSSSGLLEAPYLRKYTINLGKRQEGRVRPKSVFDCKCIFEDIKKNIQKVLHIKKKNELRNQSISHLKNCYGDGKSSVKMVKVIKNLPLKMSKKKIFYNL